MRIAMIGQKGIPARHGGVERHVEELGARLVGLGHEVTVFTRPNYTPRALTRHRGMRLVSLPSVGTKHLDAITHSLLCAVYCCVQDFEVVHYHAIGPTLVSPITRLRGRKTVATIHGQDWRRGKWGSVASAVLRAAEWASLRVPDRTIAVSRSLTKEYVSRGAKSVSYIPNGISVDDTDDTSVLREFGLSDREYVLFAGRLVPEKGLHHLLVASALASTGRRLVVAGDSSMSSAYVSEVKGLADENVAFVGYQYGSRMAALFRHAALFVLPSELEGLPLVLLEAIAYGVPILASDIPPNREVLGDEGWYFRTGDVGDLAAKLKHADSCMEELLRNSARIREAAVSEYDWDRVARQTSDLYLSL